MCSNIIFLANIHFLFLSFKISLTLKSKRNIFYEGSTYCLLQCTLSVLGGKNMLVNVTHAMALYTYKELLLLHQTESIISNNNNHVIKRDIFYEWNTISVYYSDVVIKCKLVQTVTLIASRSNWVSLYPIEMWNRFYVLKFNFRCQIWNARRSQIRVVIWKLDLANDIFIGFDTKMKISLKQSCHIKDE